ncbi:MAG: septal ring lytic transglycosylase RlpA family protein [Alphaproteobacteria bacterium]
MRLSILSAIGAILLLGGCAEAELAAHVTKQLPGKTPKTQGYFKVGNPYKVMGKWYRPQESYTHSETGIASWYGPNFHGKPTANGEIFDQYELTAAHRTLQMPSLVRVTNLENGRSIVLRVNDRGPFSRGRIIDVSKRGAELLGFKNQGTAKVRVQVLAEESMSIAEAAKRGEDTSGIEVAMNERPYGRVQPASTTARTKPATPSHIDKTDMKPPASIPGHNIDGKFYPDPVVKTVPVAPTNIFVQAGSFTNQANANALAARLSAHGQANVYPAIVNGRQFFRVRFPAANVATADGILERLARAGNPDAIIVVE